MIFEKLLSSDHNIELMFPLVFAESKIGSLQKVVSN